MPTVAEKIKERLIDAVGKRLYGFSEQPRPRNLSSYGIYIHVPFCQGFCRFCSIYRENISKQSKDAYLDALDKELTSRLPERKASWVYIGGGMPNLLSIDEMTGILATIRRRTEFERAGVEILPAMADEKYISRLRGMGITKISVDVERLSDGEPTTTAILAPASVKPTDDGKPSVVSSHLNGLLRAAAESGLAANVDLILGIPEQGQDRFLDDFGAVLAMGPAQVSVTPWIRRTPDSPLPSIPPDAQYGLIELAADRAAAAGYERRSLWTFAKEADTYDSFRDELTSDCLGFGPGAVSAFDGLESVNPDLASYVLSISNGHPMALVSEKGPEEADWKRLALMLYEGKSRPAEKLKGKAGRARNGLGRRGFYKGEELSAKGIMLVHDLIKTLQEAAPYPLMDSRYISNFAAYDDFRQDAQDRFKSRSFALFMLP